MRGAGTLGGLLGMFSLLDADEADAAVRPDIVKVVKGAIDGQKYAGKFAGKLESPSAAEALVSGNGKYKARRDISHSTGLPEGMRRMRGHLNR